MTTSITPTASRSGAGGEAGTAPGARFALIVLALLWPTQMLSMIGMLTGNAQASIALHFHTTQISWFILSTALVGGMVAPFALKAADIFGKRQVMITITLLGLVGDVIAALATNYPMLLAGRAIAGFYAPIAALAYATLREVLPPKQAASASSIVGSGIAFVAIGGPFLTGWLIDSYSFHGVLWAISVSTLIGLILLVVAVPRTHYRDPSARIDWVGGLLLGGGVTALTYGIGKGQAWGWTSSGVLGFVLGGIAALVAFVVSQRYLRHPMVQIAMLARRRVWTVFLAAALVGGVLYGAGIITQLLALYPKVVVPYSAGGHTVQVHVSDGLGWSATHLAIISLPSSILILAVGFGSGVLIRRIDSRLPLIVGSALIVVGYLLGAAFHYDGTQLLATGPVYALGFGMIVAVIPVLVMEAVEPEEQPMGSLLQNLSMGVVTTVVTTLCYVILSQHGTVVQGTQLYLDQGYKNGYYFAAAVAVVGLLASLLIPRLKRIDELD